MKNNQAEDIWARINTLKLYTISEKIRIMATTERKARKAVTEINKKMNFGL